MTRSYFTSLSEGLGGGGEYVALFSIGYCSSAWKSPSRRQYPSSSRENNSHLDSLALEPGVAVLDLPRIPLRSSIILLGKDSLATIGTEQLQGSPLVPRAWSDSVGSPRGYLRVSPKFFKAFCVFYNKWVKRECLGSGKPLRAF